MPWTILPDTALDSDGKLIPPPSNAKHPYINFGRGNYYYERVILGRVNLKQVCKTVFTGTKGNAASQIVCWLTP